MNGGKELKSARGAEVTDGRRTVRWPSARDERELRDALALELIGVCIGTLKKYGLNGKHMASLVSQAANGNHMHVPVASKVLSDMWRLGELSSKWAQDSAYLDASGRPKALNICGRGVSFQSLSREFFGRRAVDEIVTLGCKTRVMQRQGKNKVVHFGGCVMFTGNPALMLAYSVRTALWSLNTSALNRRIQKQGGEALPDRTAFAVLPREDFPDFVRMMRTQISALVEMGDRWLTARAESERRSKSKRKVTIGIQAFVFRDDAWTARDIRDAGEACAVVPAR